MYEGFEASDTQKIDQEESTSLTNMETAKGATTA
jgi:hypothetical protein